MLKVIDYYYYYYYISYLIINFYFLKNKVIFEVR